MYEDSRGRGGRSPGRGGAKREGNRPGCRVERGDNACSGTLVRTRTAEQRMSAFGGTRAITKRSLCRLAEYEDHGTMKHMPLTVVGNHVVNWPKSRSKPRLQDRMQALVN